MSNKKKIEFLNKPNKIDEWVLGKENALNRVEKEPKTNIVKTTCYLPKDLHYKARLEALQNEEALNDVLIKALEKYLT